MTASTRRRSPATSRRRGPFVSDGWVYFPGTDDGLLRVKTNGEDQHNIGQNATASTPFVTGGVVYFQGTDNKLWRVDADTKA